MNIFSSSYRDSLVEDARAILESKNLLKVLPENVKEFLFYLIHDKSHVMGNDSKHPLMEKALHECKGDVFAKPLYRGLYTETLEDFAIGQDHTFTRYQSFSEHEGIAKKFSKRGLILKAMHSRNGLNYGQFLVDAFKDLEKTDPNSYSAEDGDYMIESAEEEAEHIFPIGTKFKVTAIKGNLIEGTMQ